jgi:rhodanese-related sulfurtransferase
MVPEISVTDLAKRLSQPNPPILIDVREPDEFEFCRIEGAQLKPLGGIMQWAQSLSPDGEYVIMCHMGGRSAQATNFLLRQGFQHVTNLRGGIDAWAATVDPDIPRY